jgi:hypothetical protein
MLETTIWALLAAGIVATGGVMVFDRGGRKPLHLALLVLFWSAAVIVLLASR